MNKKQVHNPQDLVMKTKTKEELDTFLQSVKVNSSYSSNSKQKQPFTHTSLKGGIYMIADEIYSSFIELYTHAFMNGNDLYLVEKVPKDNSNIRIDLDFRTKSATRLYTENMIQKFSTEIYNFLNNYIDIQDIKICVLEKHKPRLAKKDGDIYKDGIHFHIPDYNAPKQLLYMLRDHMVKRITNIFTFDHINTPEDIYDEAIIERNAWMMYGSRKPDELYAWTLTKMYVPFGMPNGISFSKTIDLHKCELVHTFSIRDPDMGEVNFIDDDTEKSVLSYQYKKSIADSDLSCISDISTMVLPKNLSFDWTNITYDEIHKILMSISVERAINYTDWSFVMYGIVNISKDMGFTVQQKTTLIHDFSKRCPEKYNKDTVNEYIRKNTKYLPKGKGINIGTIVTYLQDDNPSAFQEIFGETKRWQLLVRNCFIHPGTSLQSVTNEKFAQLFHYFNKGKYLSTGDAFYRKNRYNIYQQLTPSKCKEYMPTKIKKILTPLLTSYFEYIKNIYIIELANTKAESTSYGEIKEKIKGIEQKYVKAVNQVDIKTCIDKTFETIREKFFSRKVDTKFNDYAYLIPFNNGVYDLNDRVFRLPKDNEYISETLGYDYCDTNGCFDRVDAIISSCFDDQETIHFIKKFFGSILERGNKIEKVTFWIGKGGNGKSGCDTLLKYALGFYYSVVPCGVFTEYSKEADKASPALAGLYRKLLGVCSETDETTKFVTASLCKLSGGDRIKARSLHQNYIEFDPTFKLLIHTNHFPKFSSVGEMLFRRIQVINFPFLFKDASEYDANNPNHRIQDNTLKDKIMSPEYRVEMINLMIHYYYIYKEEKLFPPKAVIETTEIYKKEIDVVSTWAKEHFIYDKGSNIPTIIAYEYFNEDQKKEGNEGTIKFATFTKSLTDKYNTDRRRVDGMTRTCFIDYKLQILDEDNYE